MKTLLSTVFVLLAFTASSTAANEDCNALGFTGQQLCSDCDVLGQYLKDEELVTDCKKCCVKDSGSQRYTKAELLVDQWRVSAFPQVKDFIEKHAKKYGEQLKVTYTQGSYPRLRLKGADGPSETVRIDNWKVSNMHEFLEERLELQQQQ